jgi:hypothetical protein
MKRTSRLRQIVAEHAAIRATIGQIELELDRMLARPTGPSGAAGKAGDWALPGLVRSFRAHLRRHFKLEEGGGLLGDAAAYFDPQAQREVGALIAEHRQFERAIDRICDEIDERIVPGATVHRCFDGELRKLIAHLARHEAAENALLHRVLGQASDDGRRPSASSKGA